MQTHIGQSQRQVCNHEPVNKGKDLNGVQFVSGDTERVHGWDIMTHGGFLTYLHHDACGLCTYVTVWSATKIWAYVDTPMKSSKGSKAVYETWDLIFTGKLVAGSPKVPIGTLVLSRGATLCVHSVYSVDVG